MSYKTGPRYPEFELNSVLQSSAAWISDQDHIRITKKEKKNHITPSVNPLIVPVHKTQKVKVDKKTNDITPLTEEKDAVKRLWKSKFSGT